MNQTYGTKSYRVGLKTKFIFITLLSLCMISSGAQASLPKYQYSTPVAENISNLPHQIIVIYKPEIVHNSMLYNQATSAANSRVGAVNVTKVNLKSIEGIEIVTLPANISMESAIGIYRNDSYVLSAEPRYVQGSFNQMPKNPIFSTQWGLHNIGQLASFVKFFH
jgi:hypothetical protein